MYTITSDCTISNTISITMITLNVTDPATKSVLLLDCVALVSMDAGTLRCTKQNYKKIQLNNEHWVSYLIQVYY